MHCAPPCFPACTVAATTHFHLITPPLNAPMGTYAYMTTRKRHAQVNNVMRMYLFHTCNLYGCTYIKNV